MSRLDQLRQEYEKRKMRYTELLLQAHDAEGTVPDGAVDAAEQALDDVVQSCQHYSGPSITLDEAVKEAADLLEPGEERITAEYFRGMSELIARLFPILYMPTSVRADQITEHIIAENERS